MVTAYNPSCTTFEEYWASIRLPGPDDPHFKPYVVAYDAAKRAFEAGFEAGRAKSGYIKIDWSKVSSAAAPHVPVRAEFVCTCGYRGSTSCPHHMSGGTK